MGLLCKFTWWHLQHSVQSVDSVLLILVVFTLQKLKPGCQLHLLQAEQTPSRSVHVLHEYGSLYCAKQTIFRCRPFRVLTCETTALIQWNFTCVRNYLAVICFFLFKLVRPISTNGRETFSYITIDYEQHKIMAAEMRDFSSDQYRVGRGSVNQIKSEPTVLTYIQ